MIISRGRKYIFVHIPKTGGTSLALALESRAMKDDIMLGDTPKALRRRRRLKNTVSAGRLWKHSTLSDIEGLVKQQEIEQFFCFTLVRNPWDRMVSYYHWLREQGFDHPAVTLAKTSDFRSFLRADLLQDSMRATPASQYMRDGSGQDRGNCYIRLEHFAEDARSLFDHLGFGLELPRVNASQREQDFRAFYDPEMQQIVADICAEDIARFGYHFEETPS